MPASIQYIQPRADVGIGPYNFCKIEMIQL